MHLLSLRDQTISLTDAGCDVFLAKGETIWTESSYKYLPEQVTQMADYTVGFWLHEQWIDDDKALVQSLPLLRNKVCAISVGLCQLDALNPSATLLPRSRACLQPVRPATPLEFASPDTLARIHLLTPETGLQSAQSKTGLPQAPGWWPRRSAIRQPFVIPRTAIPPRAGLRPNATDVGSPKSQNIDPEHPAPVD